MTRVQLDRKRGMKEKEERGLRERERERESLITFGLLRDKFFFMNQMG